MSNKDQDKIYFYLYQICQRFNVYKTSNISNRLFYNLYNSQYDRSQLILCIKCYVLLYETK